jgi:hypothetical protein
MENERVAKFFIGTLLDETVEHIEVQPQEYTYEGELDYENPADVAILENRMRERFSIWVYRLDFIATIKTETGEYRKILIEIQKARNRIDLMRFRNYLAEQYKKEDMVNYKKAALPITTIYILGFKLPEIETDCLKVERNYLDLTNKKILKTKSDFVEKLTHDCFIVQVERVTGRYQTRLDKLLSIFEQTNFTDDRHIVKEFKHDVDIEEMGIATRILHYSGTDPQEKKRLEDEQEAWRTINALMTESDRKYEQVVEDYQRVSEEIQVVSENLQIASEKIQVVSENLQIASEKIQQIEAEKEQIEAEKEQIEAEKEQIEAEKEQIEAEKEQIEAEKQKMANELTEKDRLIAELLQKIEQNK